MKLDKRLSIVAAAALVVGGFGLSARAADDAAAPADKPTVGQQVGNAAEKTGDAIKSAAVKTEKALGMDTETRIKGTVAQVAEAGITKGGLDDIVERFSSADRARLNQNADALKNNTALDGRIEQFQKDWKAKYNQDFKISDQDKVYDNSFAMISAGDQARTASEKIGADAAAQTAAPADNAAGAAAAGDKNASSSKSAVLHIAASHNKAALDVPVVYEGVSWKLDIPDSVDAAKLRDNVQAALTKCDDMKDQWPADVNDAYRAVTHGLLLAIYDQPDTGAQPAAATVAPDAGTGASPAQPAQPAQPAPQPEPAK